MRRHHFITDIFEAVGLPIGRIVLIEKDRPHALIEIVV